MRKTGFDDMNKDIKVAMENNPQQMNVGSGVVDVNQDELNKANFRKNSQPILESRAMNKNMTLNNYASQEHVHDEKQQIQLQAREQSKFNELNLIQQLQGQRWNSLQGPINVNIVQVNNHNGLTNINNPNPSSFLEQQAQKDQEQKNQRSGLVMNDNLKI